MLTSDLALDELCIKGTCKIDSETVYKSTKQYKVWFCFKVGKLQKEWA